MKTYTVTRVFRVEVSRDISAESFADAAEKMKTLKFERFIKSAPGAELSDWNDMSGSWIHEELE